MLSTTSFARAALRATPRARVNSQSVRALATAVDSKPENLKTFSIYRWVRSHGHMGPTHALKTAPG